MTTKLGFILVLVALFVSPVFAEEDKSKPKNEMSPMSDSQFVRIQRQLDLSETQIQEMEAIRESGGTRKQVRAILTKDQRIQLKEARQKKQKANMPNGDNS